MRKTLRIFLSLSLTTAFLAATHLCSLKSVSTEGMPSCHASATQAASDCCTSTPGAAQGESADSKCCLAPADHPVSARILRAELAQIHPDQPTFNAKYDAALHQVPLRQTPGYSGPPFFVTYVLKHTYALHAPPVVL